MKKQLEVGDKIQRFEVQMTKEVDYLDEIISVTKALAKSKYKTYKRDLDFNSRKPVSSKGEIVAKVHTKEKASWSSPDYFLIKTV